MTVAPEGRPAELDVQLVRVTKRYGDFEAVRQVSLDVRHGEFFSILGPSGCGKTTILRMVAGFMEPTEGQILIGGRDVRGVTPNRRPTSLVFQHLALFPLMNVYDNIAFGLRMRGTAERVIAPRVAEKLELINLRGYERKRVDQLSGGEKQRVAIARSLIIEPTVLLLDEPLGALDLKLREHMKEELKAIQHRVGTTFIYITHDQGEALAMSDRIAVMRQGVLEQIGTPADVYERPATPFVAYFVGENNALPGVAAAADGELAALDVPAGRLWGRNPARLVPGTRALLFIRPERVTIGDTDGAENRLQGRLQEVYYEGLVVRTRVRLADGTELTLALPNARAGALPRPGQAVTVAFAARDAYVLPETPA
jgi:spermidine/putrescine transport system ATP-binding protein